MINRKDIYIAVGVFVFLIVLRVVLLLMKVNDPFLSVLETFISGIFGALLTLFQQRARQETHVEAATDVNVNADAGKG